MLLLASLYFTSEIEGLSSTDILLTDLFVLSNLEFEFSLIFSLISIFHLEDDLPIAPELGLDSIRE